DRFLCVGERVREYLESLGVISRHIFWSPHAVDNEFFSIHVEPLLEAEARVEARRGWGIGPDDFVVLFAGKLDRSKRPGDVLRALGSMNAGARALVAGSGPLREECIELASRLRVAADFRGFLNQTELPLAYAVADCLALPSQSETWGLVVNEAMACGVPCVVSEGVGCAPDLVEPGETGEIFPLGDIDALADRLTFISEEIEAGRTRAHQCREKVRAYSFEAATSGLLSACRSVMR
ncbi:MAG: glycosyltransferase, partial [Vicinamibacteria bacterium]